MYSLTSSQKAVFLGSAAALCRLAMSLFPASVSTALAVLGEDVGVAGVVSVQPSGYCSFPLELAESFGIEATLLEVERNVLQVTDICPLDPEINEEQAAAMVASLGEHTSHPIAWAVMRLARQRRLAHVPHEEVSFIVGHGVEALVNGSSIRFGSRHFLEDDEQISFANAREMIEAFAAEGKSLLYMAADGHPLAVFALRDRLRSETPYTLVVLRELGIERIVMVTGDHRVSAQALASELGIDNVFFEQHPEEKARVVAALKQDGRRVAYIGDGVNDGPALIEADVGVSMPRAADIARATADIVLVKDRLASVATMTLFRATLVPFCS
ncbi:HAD-IC family P-type ATPase [Methylocystis sp. IM3]|uniref:HAD-IC family P-type ATPase n=1 Tax=unclassified Methylocystis TaxID=2625913 RepID=UPI0030FB5E31